MVQTSHSAFRMLLTTPGLLYRSIRVARPLSEEKGTGKEVSVDDRITGGSEEQAIGRF